MTPAPIDEQITNLRKALVWLHERQAEMPFASVGKHPQPVITIHRGGVCNALKFDPKYAATTAGRTLHEGIEHVCWQATLHHCRVEWIEPVRYSLPICRPYQRSAVAR